jgi:aromatic-L-amino-acid decarboxylase
MKKTGTFEVLAPVPLNLVCFRYRPKGVEDEETLTQLNATLIEELNQTGKVYLTHTKLKGKYTLRMQIGQTEVTQRHVDEAWALIQEIASKLTKD